MFNFLLIGKQKDELLVYKFSSSFHKFFSLFLAEEDYDQFCLAYMFTYRDFEMGTLGLAWTGDLKNAGGVCEKNGVSLGEANLDPLSSNV